jgi:serine protease Do
MPANSSIRDSSVRAFPCLIFCLGLCAAIVGAWAATVSQGAELGTVERAGPVSAEKRAELYRELETNAKVMEAQSAVLKAAAKLVGPTVVNIETTLPPPPAGSTPSRKEPIEEDGSGVVFQWKDKFYILTNRHVVRNAAPKSVKISLADGRLIYPTKIMQDPDSDVAVLAIAAADLIPAKLGDSDKMEIGDFVLAIGSPFGLRHSVTLGIISAKGRRDLQLSDARVPFQDFLQTDAAIHPGNSGGPLVNLHGEVIGINTAIASSTGHNEGVGFAIPSNMFLTIARQLIDEGKVTRAFLGVNLNSKFGHAAAAEAGLPAPRGTQINGITKGGPAEAAKLQAGDIILEYNHIPVDDDAHLINLVGLTPVGVKVPLLIFRDRQTIVVDVEVADRAKF